MTANTLWQNIEGSDFGVTIAESLWMFPTIETVHVIALVTVIGAIVAMDLRLLGLASMNKTVTAMAHDTIPLTWVAFGLALITGTLLWISKAATYMANPYFLWKMGLLALAGLNMAIFHRITAKGMADWDAPGAAVPRAAKVSGLLSLVCWAAIPFCGRVIGFTLGSYY
jgi:hypothetical protein